MKKINKHIIAGILVVIMAVSATLGYMAYNSFAARTIDESKTVSFAAFSARKNIPETTIFIGTHLITLESATDELWEKAIESQEASDQHNIYYKSELTYGTWFDITDAESIRDINGDGNAISVSEEEMADLLVMYYTFDYGITRLAINDMRHCIFDGEYDYWDLYHLTELESVKNEYDMIVSRNNENSRMDKFYRDFLSEFFNRDLRNNVTAKADDALYALQDVYDALVAEDKKDEADIIYELMAKLDNKRRAEIFRQLADEEEISTSTEDENLTPFEKAFRDALKTLGFSIPGDPNTAENRKYINVLDEILQKANGTDYPDEDEFITNDSVVSAISDNTEDCQTAYLEKSNNVLESNGDRVIDTLIYEVSNKIIENSGQGLSDEMYGNITRLGYLFNIDDAKITHKEEELKVVDEELLGPVTDKFIKGAMAYPTDAYNTALNAGSSDSALSGLLDLQETFLDADRLELQDVITAKIDRTDVDEAMAFTYDRINLTQDVDNKLPTSDFKTNAHTQLKRHIKWLSDKLAELYEKSNTGDSELEKLKAESDSLLLKQQSALDNNDLKKAKEFGAARDAVLDRIDELNDKLNSILDDPNASAGDKSLAQTLLNGGNNGIDQLLANLLANLLDMLNNGDDISDGIDLLSALGDTDGLNALKEEAANTGKDDVFNQINDTLNEMGADDGNGNGNGNGNGFGLSEDDLLGLLANLLGDINSLSAEQLASAIRAMEIIYDMGYENAGSLASRLANIAKTKGSKYVYNRINDSGQYEYVSLYTLAQVAGYRWTYDNSKRASALIGYGTNPTYQFTAGDASLYEIVNKDTRNPKLKVLSKMKDRVKLASNLHATVDVASDYFNCVACHIKKSNYGICITSKMESDAKSLVDQLLAAIQGTN